MEDGNNRAYGFGEFRVDARRRILSKNGEIISLTPRNFDLLLMLIEHEGRILSHDDILDRVWEGTFVEQANLKNAVSVLRRALGEGPNEAAFIRTIPRRGYSFVASVQLIAIDPGAQVISYEETEQEVIVEESWEVDDNEQRIDEREIKPRLRTSRKTSLKISRRTVIFAAVATLAVIAGGFGLRAYFADRASIIYDADAVVISKITTEGNLVGGDASISPDGKYLVYAVRESENVSLWTRQIATGISRQISPVMQGSVWACSLTPDEDFIYYIFNSNADRSKSGLFKISTFGGSAQRISDNTGGALSIAPDGKRLAVLHLTPDLATNIETMNLDGGDQKVVWTRTGDLRVWNVKYSPDGSSILLSVRKQLPDKMVHYIGEIPVDGGSEKIILPDQEKQIADAIWLPNKKSLLLSVRELNAELRQIWQYFPASGEWKRVTNDNASYRGISLTKDGKTLVASQESRLTSLWASPTGVADDIAQVMSGTHYLIDVGWTTDSRIVYSAVENSRESIGIINADGTANKLITTGDDGIWIFPAPSLDGKHIAFASLRSGRRQIWAIEADGRNPAQMSTFDTDVYDGRLLADGKTSILLQLVTPQKSSLVVRNGDGELRTLVENGTKRWAISPDEKLVAVQMQDPQTQKGEVVILRIDTGEIIRKLDFMASRVLRWTPDGKALAYDVIEGVTGKILIRPLNGSPAKPFLVLKSEDIFSFDWSMDGTRFAVIRGNHLTDAVKITVGNAR